MGKKIVVVNAGPRIGWNTETLISEASKGAESKGAEIQRFDLFKLEKYTGCISCFGCKREQFKGHTNGNSLVIVENDGLFYMMQADITYVDEALYENKLSTVFDDLAAARETLDRVREFVRNHPTVYLSTHSPQGYVNLEAKRVIDLDNPVETIFEEFDFNTGEATGKYICSICGYVYDPAEHDGVAFEDQPDDFKCPRCKQGKDKFNPA